MTTKLLSPAPCAKCPFRKDVPIYLRAGAREEIARSIADGASFACHETLDHIEAEDTDLDYAEDDFDTSKSLHCAGAAKAIMLSGGTTQLMRWAERLGNGDELDKIEARGAECWDLATWPTLTEGSTGDSYEIEEVETCSVVDSGCLAPAGFLGTNGGVVHGTVAAGNQCSECFEPVCDNCLSKDGYCPECQEYEDEDV